MPDEQKKRPQTPTEREVASELARSERSKVAAAAVATALAHVVAVPAAPDEYVDEVTGQHEGDELALLRSRRPPEDRIDRLERKHDALGGDVGTIKLDVATIKGQMVLMPQLVAAALGQANVAAETRRVVVTAQTEVDKAAALDGFDAKKAKRALVAKIVASALGAGGLGALFHALLERF